MFDQDDRIKDMLDMEQFHLRNVKQNLLTKMYFLRDQLSYAIQETERDGKPNSLGVVQGTGSGIDILCAEYSIRLENVKMLTRLHSASRWSRYKFKSREIVRFKFSGSEQVGEFDSRNEHGIVVHSIEESDPPLYYAVPFIDIVSVVVEE